MTLVRALLRVFGHDIAGIIISYLDDQIKREFVRDLIKYIKLNVYKRKHVGVSYWAPYSHLYAHRGSTGSVLNWGLCDSDLPCYLVGEKNCEKYRRLNIFGLHRDFHFNRYEKMAWTRHK